MFPHFSLFKYNAHTFTSLPPLQLPPSTLGFLFLFLFIRSSHQHNVQSCLIFYSSCYSQIHHMFSTHHFLADWMNILSISLSLWTGTDPLPIWRSSSLWAALGFPCSAHFNCFFLPGLGRKVRLTQWKPNWGGFYFLTLYLDTEDGPLQISFLGKLDYCLFLQSFSAILMTFIRIYSFIFIFLLWMTTIWAVSCL